MILGRVGRAVLDLVLQHGMRRLGSDNERLEVSALMDWGRFTYASTGNRVAIQGRHRDGILRKAARGHPLRASEMRFNKLLSKRRFRIEHVFGAGKSQFDQDRARYLGSAKTHAQRAMTAIPKTLLKAADTIQLTESLPVRPRFGRLGHVLVMNPDPNLNPAKKTATKRLCHRRQLKNCDRMVTAISFDSIEEKHGPATSVLSAHTGEKPNKRIGGVMSRLKPRAGEIRANRVYEGEGFST